MNYHLQARRNVEKPDSSSLSKRLVQQFFKTIRQLLYGVVALVAIAMILALISYSPLDPGWSQTSSSTVGKIHNYLGYVGAIFADVMRYFWGNAAYLMPALLLFGGWRMLMVENSLHDITIPDIAVKLLGCLAFLAAGAGVVHFAAGTGGVFGQYVSMFGQKSCMILIPFFGVSVADTASSLFMLFIMLISFSIVSGWSIWGVIDRAGFLMAGPVSWLWNKIKTLFAQRLEQRALRKQEEQDRMDQEAAITDDLTDETIDSLDIDDGFGLPSVQKLMRTKPALVTESIPLSPISEPESTAELDLPSAAPAPTTEKASVTQDAADVFFGGDQGKQEPTLELGEFTNSSTAITDDIVLPPPPIVEEEEMILHHDVVLTEDPQHSIELDFAPSAMKTIEVLDADPTLGKTVVITNSQQEAMLDFADSVDLSELPFEIPSTKTEAELVSEATEEEIVMSLEDMPLPAHAFTPPPRPVPPALRNGGAELLQSLPPVISQTLTKAPSRVHYANVGQLPSVDLLDDSPQSQADQVYPAAALDALSRQVELVLQSFGIRADVVAVEPGPVIVRFELQPAPGVKVSQIVNLSKDLARGLSVISVRIVEIIPGKPYVGLEIPNRHRQIVYFKGLLESPEYQQATSPTTLILGKNISDHPVVADLAKMPHLLVAGTTGSGKSVGINTMLLSLLFKARPEQVRLILIDPKMLELSVYEQIPHLLAPVVTDMKEAANALRWCVGEMERRYKLMAQLRVRNIAGFNQMVQDAIDIGQPLLDPLWVATDHVSDEMLPPTLEPLPYIVIVIDELADMMMVVGKKVEELIARLAQKARAAGIHLILATQRPSVDVITGLIKANVPTRIAFQVSSKIDSRTILDQMGAETLLGHGDMLYMPPGSGFPQRVHGAFVKDHEVNAVIDFLKTTGAPQYISDMFEEPAEPIPGLSPEIAGGSAAPEGDPLYDQAVQIVLESRKASISYVQRQLRIGYNRAARLIEDMERAGVLRKESNGGRETMVINVNNDFE